MSEAKLFQQGRTPEPERPGFFERSSRVLDKTIFFGLLAVIVLTAIPYGTVDAWWEAVFECAIFGLTAIWLFEVLLRGSWQVNRLFILLPLILITAYAFLQTAQLPSFLSNLGNQGAQHTLTIDTYQTHLTAVKTLALTLFLALLLLHTSSVGRFYWLVRVVIGVGLASAVFGILRQLLQLPGSTQPFILPFLGYGMGYGQFLSPNAFSYVVEMSLGLVLGLLLGGGVRRDHIAIYLAVTAVIWTALVLSNSRGGVLGMVCQSIFVLFVALSWYSARRLAREDGKKKWFSFIGSSSFVRPLLVVLIVATLLTGVLWMGGDRLAGKINQGNSDGTTRKEIWHSTWNLVKHNPWTGVGFGAYFLAIPEYQIGSGRTRIEQAHNDYLDLAANGGIVAIALSAWFIFMVIWRARSSLKSDDGYRRAACLGAMAGILSVGVHSLVDFGLQLTGIGVLFASLIVIAIADRKVDATATGRKSRRVDAS
jgi:O-antigen ligase